MAQPVTAKFGKVRVLLGDGATPEVFAAPCGLTSKGITLSQGLSEVNIPDCDGPDMPAWVERDTTSLSVSISGEGVLAAGAVPTWIDAAKSTDPTNAKFEVEFTTGVLVYTGAFKVDSFAITAALGERANCSISMQSSGEVTIAWTTTP